MTQNSCYGNWEKCCEMEQMACGGRKHHVVDRTVLVLLSNCRVKCTSKVGWSCRRISNRKSRRYKVGALALCWAARSEFMLSWTLSTTARLSHTRLWYRVKDFTRRAAKLLLLLSSSSSSSWAHSANQRMSRHIFFRFFAHLHLTWTPSIRWKENLRNTYIIYDWLPLIQIIDGKFKYIRTICKLHRFVLSSM